MITIINKNNEQISFKTDLPLSLANAIRRSANYIPILAVDSLEISKNDSALYDEIIAHRVGLVPLKNENLKLPAECGCGKEEGCSKCSMKLKLSEKGPGIIYSDQMSPGENIIHKIPITILDKDQELEFVAIAKRGKGIEHAKFSPGLIYYKYENDGVEGNDEEFKKLLEDVKKEKEENLIMTIESWGQISPKEIFISSTEMLNEEIKNLLKKIK